MGTADDPIVPFASPAAWESWLAAEGERADGTPSAPRHERRIETFVAMLARGEVLYPRS